MSAHREAAEALLAEAVLSRTGSDVESSRQLQALVHATLEVAEQQRIANLIAWTTGADFQNQPNATQRAIILEGLGL